MPEYTVTKNITGSVSVEVSASNAYEAVEQASELPKSAWELEIHEVDTIYIFDGDRDVTHEHDAEDMRRSEEKYSRELAKLVLANDAEAGVRVNAFDDVTEGLLGDACKRLCGVGLCDFRIATRRIFGYSNSPSYVVTVERLLEGDTVVLRKRHEDEIFTRIGA